MKTILLVEDDVTLSNGIALSLGKEDDTLIQCHNLKDAKRAWRERPVSLVILDVNLPDGNGLDWCRVLRQESAVPILLLTANDTEIDIVSGLESGADDYLTKPFSLAVLRARVAALLRRSIVETANSTLKTGPFRFEFDAMRFYKQDIPIELSKTEQRLLRVLAEHPGQTITRGMLLEKVWDEDGTFVDENALSVSIRRLRGKLEENPAKPEYIKTVYGIGYSWAVEK